MKLGFRGILLKIVAHLKDEVPQVIIFNVDLVSSLFSTYCMQSTPSVATTCVLMAAKSLQMCVSLYDIELVIQRMKALKKAGAAMKSLKVQGNCRVSSMDSNTKAQSKASDSRVVSSVLFALVNASTRKMTQTTSSLTRFTRRSQKAYGMLSKVAPMLSEFIEEEFPGPARRGH
ncbi:unnamed protein product [Phytophthora fragariaefolia]|uniref:Unnamed protein product n=1 Tax=Phytophthora fragariaefolia TaxID=1490495 RepID=A0A9W6UDW4_9STRA|nr:unnamed protein product [Phytophthora fragariaefolia]